MNSLFNPPFQTVFYNGVISPGAKIYFYLTGTLTPATVYDAAGTPLANPVVANIYGRFQPIYIDPTIVYRAKLTTSTGSVIDDVDPYNTIISSDTLPYKAPGNNTVTRTVSTKLAERLSMEDLGAVGDGVTNDASVIQAAIEARYGTVGTTGQIPYYVEIHGTPGKIYKFTSPLLVRQSHLRFIGNGASVLCTGGSAFYFTPETVPTFIEHCAVIDWNITGATFAAIRCDPGVVLLNIEYNRITNVNNGIYLCSVESNINSNYIRTNTGKGIQLIARQVGGIGIYHESQRCVVTNNIIWDNAQGGIYLENGGGHFIGYNDSEANGTANPEIIIRNSFGNSIIGHYCEPSPAATGIIYIDDASALVPGRTSEGNQIIGGTFGGGATYDLNITSGNNTYISGIRFGSGNIIISAPAQNTTIGFQATPPASITDSGTNTRILDAMFQGKQIRIPTTGYMTVGGIKVIGAQQAAIPDVAAGGTTDANARATINALLVACRAHGLIA